MSPYTVRILESLNEVPRAAWDALCPGAPPFLSWDFLQALEEAGCVTPERGWRPVHLSLWRDQHLVAAAPAYLKGNSEGEFVFDWSIADLAHKLRLRYYPKLIVAVPFTPVTGPRFLLHPDLDAAEAAGLRRLLGETALTLAEELDLSSVHVLFPPQQEAEALCAEGSGLPLRRRVGVQFHWHNEGYRSFDDFLTRFSSKRRAMIRRERREVREAGLQVSTLRGPFSDEDVDLMYAFYTSTVEKFVWGRHYLNRRAFALLAERLPSQLEFVTARAGRDGPPLAGAINFQKDGCLYGRYWGQREGPVHSHPFLHFEVCYYHSIEECIERGVRVFEPGAGGEHKMARGFLPAFTYSAHHIRHPRLGAPVYDFLRREEIALREQVAQILADSPLRKA